MILEIKNLSLAYGKKQVLTGVSMEVRAGEMVCILGPNGVGKTSLFKAVLGFLKPVGGEIRLNGRLLGSIERGELARHIGHVPQVHKGYFPYKVLEVVLFGRTAHLGFFETPGRKDRIIAEECLDMLNIRHLKDKVFTRLSGGEKQMVIIARALAQQPGFLVMDEPTSSLDFGNQARVLRQVSELKNRNLGIIMATHSPDHAFICGTRAALFHCGTLLASGNPEDIITEENLRKVYGIKVSVIEPTGNVIRRKLCVPWGGDIIFEQNSNRDIFSSVTIDSSPAN